LVTSGGLGAVPVPASDIECVGRLDQRDAFGPLSPHGRLRVTDGMLSWQPDGWGVPVWTVPAGEVIGGAAGALSSFELWLETPVTGAVAVSVDPPDGAWAARGNVPDLRGQVLLDRFVGALRAGGARILGEPRSISSRPGAGSPGVIWPM
jgi:hypothetical protein